MNVQPPKAEHDHDHVFGQDARKTGERRTLIVVVLTATTMVFEIAAGVAFGSMALLADGLHMGSHAVALGIAVFAYVFARRHAASPRYSFGTGKVNALGGFSGAILLAVFALFMVWESVHRFIEPQAIAFNQAIFVAFVGLIVNGLSIFILKEDHHHGHGHDDDHGHDHEKPASQGQDHNLRSAYLHVMADALTSVAAIVALLAGKYLGANWMDPAMGIVGAILIVRWSRGLIKTTSKVLLDHQAPLSVRNRIRGAVEESGQAEVRDLHVWSIGPGIYAAEIVVAGSGLSAEGVKAELPESLGLVHVTVEIRTSGQSE